MASVGEPLEFVFFSNPQLIQLVLGKKLAPLARV